MISGQSRSPRGGPRGRDSQSQDSAPLQPAAECARRGRSRSGRRPRIHRHEIITAAAAGFYANGYADTTLATVARQLQVTDKAIYYYFRNKDALYLETVNACMDWMAAVLDAIDSGEATGLDKIKAFARRLIRPSARRRPYLRSLPDHLEETELGCRFRAKERAQEERLIGWVEQGIVDGSIRPDDPRMLWKWNQGALMWLDAWGRDCRYSFEALEAAAMNMLDRSLGTGAAPRDAQ